MLCHNPFFKSTVGITKNNWEGAIPFGCGQCLSCRINQRRIWTHRLMLEHRTSKDSAFVTLTYDDENKPSGNLLCKRDFQLYLKRLRKIHSPSKLRFFGVGEYGNYPNYRPHYHLCLFSDLRIERKQIDYQWKLGFTMTGDVTKDSAQYIAGYTVKKLTARNDQFLDILSEHAPEFTTMSKMDGGIGLPAVKRIAKILKNNKFFNKEKVLKELTIGNKVWPLGRYLTNKLMEELGQEHALKGQMFWDFQAELYEKHKQHLETPGKFIAEIYNEHAQKRHVQEKRFKIYNKRRNI